MEPFARTIDAAKKYVVSSTLDRVDWNAELVRGTWDVVRGLSKHIDLKLVSRLELGSGRWRCGMSLEGSHRVLSLSQPTPLVTPM
jgi:hypothetical protein